MLNTVLPLTRPLVILDVESTGLSLQTDRIVELGFEMWTADGLSHKWNSLINPTVPIPQSASRIHGITDYRVQCCRACGFAPDEHERSDCSEFRPVFTFAQIATNLAQGFTGCDFGGMRVRFDLALIAAEMKRAKVEWSYNDAHIIDASRLEQLALPRTLSHLYEKYVGERYTRAHNALDDVHASTLVIERQLQEHDVLPHSVEDLHRLSWPDMIDTERKFHFQDGVPVVNFGKWRGKPMSAVDPDYWSWVLSADFSDEVKAIAAKAKLGQFPTP